MIDPYANTIKVKVWGAYRRAEVLTVKGNYVRVRILGGYLCQGMKDVWTVEKAQVRKADHHIFG